MKHVGHVSGEGGPLLIADAALTLGWRGREEGGADYRLVCALFDERGEDLDGLPIDLGAGSGVLWELCGSGSADVFLPSDHEVLLVRAWLDDEDALFDLAEATAEERAFLGHVTVITGAATILWASESGACFENEVRLGRPVGDTSIDAPALTLPLPRGTYGCFHDVVEVDGGVARRCFIERVP